MQLSLERLSKRFKNVIAVDRVSINLHEGVYGFLGANGAGKTTLMQMICGIISPTEGEVKINGKNNVKLGEEFRDMLGYLPQELGYFPGFTAYDFMLYISSIKGLNPGYAKKKTAELLELVNLSADTHRKIQAFSGGMKKRLGIAQALLNDPSILILDEPTAGLDPKERAYFRGMISNLSKDKIVILSTHIVSDVEFIADQILIMKNGKFIRQGTVDELTGELKGNVWKCTVSDDKIEFFNNNYCIVNSHHRGGNIDMRIVCDEKPDKNAVEVEPALEDLYLKCFNKLGERG